MTRDEAKKEIDDASKMAKKVLARDGCHNMISIAYSPNHVDIIDTTSLIVAAEKAYGEGDDGSGHEAKNAAAKAVRFMLKELSAFGIITIAEAWMSKAKKGSDVNDIKVMPRNDPERQEILYVTYEFKVSDGPKYAGIKMFPFSRNGEKIVFGKLKESDGEGVGGRFSRMLE